MTKRSRYILGLVVASVGLIGTVHADVPAAGNLMGHRGILRAAAANNQPAGFIGVGTVFQGFAAKDFLGQGEDHSRMVNSYSISYAPFRFVEAAFALHVTSDQSTVGNYEELMVAVGDPELSIKGRAELGHGVALGGLFDVRFPSGSGFFQASMSATSFLVAALAAFDPTGAGA